MADAPNTQQAPNSSPAKPAGKPDRLNLALKAGSLEYLQTMSGFDTVSVTQYLNRLIEEDRIKRADIYENLKALRGK
ncbi:hypothetical protein C4J81_18685 (plasmid) [Deltaproteobacteria bacterium Smac51]|nr:hypothetical protein C4J81_18685 [Deltaproteobacteria bacterium Smac51]